MKNKLIIVLLIFIILPLVSCNESSDKEIPDSAPDPISLKKDSRMDQLENMTLDLPEEIRKNILTDIVQYVKYGMKMTSVGC